MLIIPHLPFFRKHFKPKDSFEKLKRIAPKSNAFTFKFADELLEEIRTTYHEEIESFLLQEEQQYLFKGGQLYQHTHGDHYIRSYDDKPLIWVSCNTDQTYHMYHRFFDALKLEQDLKLLIDTKENIRLYCGFLVIGNQAQQTSFHMDYYPGANAYTLITPLFKLESTHGNLLYENKNRRVKTYTYQLNEAIILGDKFYHSTQPYPLNNTLRVLLSLTFGSDKLDYWHITKCTLENQSSYLVLPCGHLNGHCKCLQKHYS